MRKHYPLNSNGAEDAGQLPWKDGVPSTGTEGSYPGQALFTDSEAEILAAIDASGQARNGSDLAQLIQAIARGIYLGQFGGTANALAAAIPNNIVFSALQPGTRFKGFVTATNTAGVTFAITGIGTASGTVQASLLTKAGSALQAGDLPVNQLFEIQWDGSAFRLVAAAASEQPLPATPSSTVQFTLPSAQSVPNNSNSQLNLQGAAPPWGTFSNGTLTVSKAGNYSVNLVGTSNIVPSAQTSHNTTFNIYINGQPVIPQTMVNWTSTTQSIGLSNSFLGYLAAGTTIAGWTYLGNSGTTDTCQVLSALMNVTKVF